MTTTEKRMRRFALRHLRRCGSNTEGRDEGALVLQRCERCHATIAIRPGEGETVDEVVLRFSRNATESVQ